MNWLQEFFPALGKKLIEELSIGGKSVSDGITELLNFGAVQTLHIGTLAIPITKAMINIFITILILPLFSWFLTKSKAMKPNRVQAVVESLIGTLRELCTKQGMNKEQIQEFLPFSGALFCYILISNLLSIFDVSAAAVNPAFPISMAFFTIICIIVWGIHFVGIKNFLKGLVSPKAFMAPFNILDYFIKPLSLAFRLFGNIFGASILIAFLRAVVPLVLPQLLGLWFDIGDGIIQAIVFSYLATSYVGEIIEKAHSPEEETELAVNPTT